MAIPGRQYGLTLPKKAQQLHPVLQKPSVFGNDSDDEEETSVSESLQREAAKKQAMKQTKLEIQKALAEDSTVYEYDSIYDEMKKKKEESNPKLLLGKDRKPKYIHNLLKAVEIRKKEQEKRMEKKIQREREMEKGEFDDKEAFVTSAYKKKLQERAEEEERERRAAALEARLDVTKQSDLSGFYRHLLNQAVGEEEVPTCSFREARSGIKEEKSKGYSDEVSSEDRPTPHENCILQTVVKVEENPDADSDFDAKSSEDDEMEEDNKVNCRREKGTETLKNDSRHHRSHTHSQSSSEEREHGTKYHTKSSKSRGHEKREDQHQERQSREDNYYTDRDYQKEKKDSHRHREASYRDSHWKRHEQEDRLRGRDQRERNDREWKREKDREKYPSREQERDRQRNDYDRHIEKGGEKEEKSKEKEEHMKARKERYENSDKYRDRENREVSVQSSERNQERKESPNSRAKDRFLNQERANKMRNMEKDKEGNTEKPSSSETSLGAKHRFTEKCQGTGKEQERPHETANKFAKRSNEETVMSARDRYLARQMARVNAKTYIEKEDD
ncbi:nuclear speckle splicing regulatory protein 1 isoform X1 [Delphinapterus leucas]|uniref:Nuclear speckle splicing regulatory protein 1 n=2 Tax=Delphinapterus leucas TaxID=9749 RepID=A0A2Y9Q6W0_DELLE|nr:nuclear speckle splicing regulatory protein 1 isoform X1 [Delphinapterus leucas]